MCVFCRPSITKLAVCRNVPRAEEVQFVVVTVRILYASTVAYTYHIALIYMVSQKNTDPCHMFK